MSLFFGRPSQPEQRLISSLPWSVGGESAATSMDTQLSLIPVYAAVRLISESIASLPLQAYRKSADARVPVALPSILGDPRPGRSRIAWVQQPLVSLLLRGNAYGLKSGYDPTTLGPQSVTWVHPDDVTYTDADGWRYKGRTVAESDMFHIAGMAVPGQRLGVSPIRACQMTTDTGLATQRFVRDWFKGRAIPGMVFKNTDQVIDSAVASAVKDRMKSSIRNGDPFVTGKDWDLDIITLPAQDAGFIESTRMTATQIANVHGIPPEMIGGETGQSLTYSTTEGQGIQLHTYGMRPWIVRMEEAFATLLPTEQYVKLNAKAFLRVDTKSRYDIHRIAREIGMNNIDEIRALEDEQPLPDGKGQDYTPLGKSGPPPKEIR